MRAVWALLVLAQATACVSRAPLPDEPKPLTALTLPTLADGAFDPASLSGKVVAINVWSPSCGPCLRELPALESVANELSGKGFALVTVMSEGSVAHAARVVAKTGLTAPVLLGTEALLRTFHVDAYPWTIVVGRDGRAVAARRGAHTRAQFAAWMREVLNDKPPRVPRGDGSPSGRPGAVLPRP